MRVLSTVIVTALFAGGCKAGSLSDMRPMLVGNGLECQLTLNFKKAPKTGDVHDVRVRFSSVVLFQDEEFNWDYMTQHDFHTVEHKDWLGNMQGHFEPVPETTPDSEPPIGGSMSVQFQLPSQAEVKVNPGDETGLRATFFWAGVEQDSAARGLFLAYQSK